MVFFFVSRKECASKILFIFEISKFRMLSGTKFSAQSSSLRKIGLADGSER